MPPLSQEQYERDIAKRKQQLGIYDWNEIDKLTFPGYFTAYFDYVATCEGNSVGVSFFRAGKAEALRRRIRDDFGAYFGESAEVREGLDLLPEFEHLIPQSVRSIMKGIVGGKAPLPAGAA